MSKRAGLVLFLAMAACFFLLNLSAHKGYFQDDDLDTMGWTPFVPYSEYLTTLISPRVHPANFRPVAHFYYRAMAPFHLDFAKYILALQCFHLFNVWLLWKLMRKIGIGAVASSVGAFFYAFHPALLDVTWKPMYIFDLLCTTFCLSSLLLYAYDRWILSLIAFWLAYKSKELAIALPAVLAAYEILIGRKRWKRLLPFFAVSLSFGLQGLLLSRSHDNDYTFRFSLDALKKTMPFYSSKVFFVPYAGLILLALPFIARDRRLWFGISAMCLLVAPLLFLPGRLFAVYWCLPLTGVAIALAALAANETPHPGYAAAVALFLLIWIPWDFICLRRARRATLALENGNRAYVAELQKFAGAAPHTNTFVWDGLPPGFQPHGVTGAISCVFRAIGQKVQYIDDPHSKELLENGATLLKWTPAARRLRILTGPAVPGEFSYLNMDEDTDKSQLNSGWYDLEAGSFRWIQPQATATLRRPDTARQFELVANVTGEQVRGKRIELDVLLDGEAIGHHTFTHAGWETLRWDLKPGPAARHAKVEFRVTPPYHASNGDPRVFGVTVMSFGFLPK